MVNFNNAPSWPAAKQARLAWLSLHNDPSASANAKLQAKNAYRGLMASCLRELGMLPELESDD